MRALVVLYGCGVLERERFMFRSFQPCLFVGPIGDCDGVVLPLKRLRWAFGSDP